MELALDSKMLSRVPSSIRCALFSAMKQVATSLYLPAGHSHHQTLNPFESFLIFLGQVYHACAWLPELLLKLFCTVVIKFAQRQQQFVHQGLVVAPGSRRGLKRRLEGLSTRTGPRRSPRGQNASHRHRTSGLQSAAVMLSPCPSHMARNVGFIHKHWPATQFNTAPKHGRACS